MLNPDSAGNRRTFLTLLRALLCLASVASLLPHTMSAQKSARPGAAGPRVVSPPPVEAKGNIRVTVAVVLSDMTVRPVPLHAIELISAVDSTQRIMLRTGLDGTSSQAVKVGTYILRSVQPVPLNDSSYRWEVPVRIAEAGASVELTNANALVVATRRVAARQVAPEREVFEKFKRGVFRIEAGLGHGSGFLAQMPGDIEPLVVTNDHVVVNDTLASVYLDSVTRVPAVVVARDRDADIAILRLPSGRCADCPALKLASTKENSELVVAGERVLAIGYPLNQEMTLTTGIASSIREGAIISDVNINHGNSGGPMLNLAGEVIGINAFGDFTSQGGPGISGAITITRIASLLQRLPTSLAAMPAPANRQLASMPRTSYPNALLKLVADSADREFYKRILFQDADKFTLNITTPVLSRVLDRLAENEVASDRREREKEGKVSKDEVYSESKQRKDWEQYVGNANTPVVTITISPKVGETGGSTLLRVMAAAGGSYAQASLVFQGDVRGARFYRNGVEVEPIRGGHGPITVREENRWVKLKDVADYGYYVLPPEAFAPDSDGTPARLKVVIRDLKNPNDISERDIEGEASAWIWNDFHAYFTAVAPQRTWIEANPKLRSREVHMACDAQTGGCKVSK